MPNPKVADLIAKALVSGLKHPGSDDAPPFVMPLPTFNVGSLDPDMAKAFAKEAGLPHPDIAKLVGEAIVELIETDSDYYLVSKGDLATMRAAASAAVDKVNHQPEVYCHCGIRLFSLNITDWNTQKPRVYGHRFIEAMHQLSPECATGHRPVES